MTLFSNGLFKVSIIVLWWHRVHRYHTLFPSPSIEPTMAILASLLQETQKCNTYFVLLMSKTPFTFEKLLNQMKNVTMKNWQVMQPRRVMVVCNSFLKLIKECL